MFCRRRRNILEDLVTFKLPRFVHIWTCVCVCVCVIKWEWMFKWWLMTKVAEKWEMCGLKREVGKKCVSERWNFRLKWMVVKVICQFVHNTCPAHPKKQSLFKCKSKMFFSFFLILRWGSMSSFSIREEFTWLEVFFLQNVQYLMLERLELFG